MAEAKKTVATSTYRSNPFSSTMNQLGALIKTNPLSSLTLGLIIIASLIVGVVGAGLLTGLFNTTFGNIVIIVLSIAYIIFVYFRLVAASYYMQTASREGRALTAKQAIADVAKKNYTEYLMATVAASLIIFAGFVAFALPGIYLLGRLALAPYIALNEGLDVGASLKRSWQLSSGHWFELMGAMIASVVLLPYGILTGVGAQSGLAGRYFELTELKKSSTKKVETHWMNYLLVALVVVFGGLYALLWHAALNENVVAPGACGDSFSTYSVDCANDFSPGLKTAPTTNNPNNFDNYNLTPAQ